MSTKKKQNERRRRCALIDPAGSQGATRRAYGNEGPKKINGA